MKMKIGFSAALTEEEREKTSALTVTENAVIPVKKSVVQVFFPERNITLGYYNDAFDLQKNDIVYVDGELAGLRGYVVGVNYTFKIKLSDYKRVLSRAVRNIVGTVYDATSHFITFDRNTIPYEKILTWYKAPSDGEGYAEGNGDEPFSLSEGPVGLFAPQICDRGYDYFADNRVVYISLDGTEGRAIVQGSVAYEVSFTYRDGSVSSLVCDCFCGFYCKHEYAVILQLHSALSLIEKQYADKFDENGYFAAVKKSDFFSFAVDGNKKGTLTLG